MEKRAGRHMIFFGPLDRYKPMDSGKIYNSHERQRIEEQLTEDFLHLIGSPLCLCFSDRKMTEPSYMPIKEVRPSQKNINVMFIVLEIGKPTRTKDGHDVRSVKVADKSGSINISIWDEAGDLLQTGDICKLTKGYSNVWKNCLTLYTGKIGEITKIGEFCLQFTELPNMSEPNPDFVKNEPPTQRKSPTEGNDAKNQQGNSPQTPNIQTSNRPPLMGTPPGGMNFQNTRPQDPRMAPHDPRLMNPQHNRGGGPPHGIRPMNGQSGRGMPRR